MFKIGEVLSDKTNQRKIAVVIAAALALFSTRIPLLSNVTSEQIAWVIGIIGVWIAQSGANSAVKAHAEGQVAAALVNSAGDAASVFKQLTGQHINDTPTAPAATQNIGVVVEAPPGGLPNPKA